MSTLKLITQEESLHDSWVKLHFDSCSEHGEDMPALCDITDLEKMLLEAQRESSSSSRTSSHCSSPRRVQTPPLISAVSINTHTNTQTTHHCTALLHGFASIKMQEEVVAESKQETEAIMRICNWSSRPENIPPAAFIIKRPKQNRVCNGNTDKNEEINTHLLKILLPSLVFTHIIMLGLGICIGRRLSAQCSVI
ncbi:BCL2 interacting protein 4 isoform X1 [Myxocyprinus asiaticus]|uniref:BCL2 interacting protein 4 isoform X1 n=1 Tax=Myxocyprinus asiaticus TaxID=70543 RepID=UPI00222144C2|nr:BCL2 interacting protein 4 isoform X1 [Myxocyprinus asiaticus]